MDNKEKLISVTKYFNFINPHPYLRLGAPYKDKTKLWSLREGVVSRLLKVNEFMKLIRKDYSLIIYDTWRPIEVQKYMFHLAFKDECKKRNLEINIDQMDLYPEIVKEVEKYWAYPTVDERCPPPHSTGAALDISLADRSGNLIGMGSEIDEMDESSSPDFYEKSTTEEEIIWHIRRVLLRKVMHKFGFAQHPNEWWHFSYGDQLWAWKNKNEIAIYGKYKGL